ncbi:MAG: nuclear transport factor 2 family protein [Pseudomonadota bacterium]
MTDPEPLLAWYAGLTPHTVARAGEFYAADAQFRDPFNDVRGVAAIKAIFRHMFAHTEEPRFVIGERIVQGDQAFVTWLFVFRLHGVPYQIAGGSHLRFNPAGLVVMHRDYWDAAEELLAKLPLIGAPIRWLRARFRVPMSATATNGSQK